jgi:hypothetical protein
MVLFSIHGLQNSVIMPDMNTTLNTNTLALAAPEQEPCAVVAAYSEKQILEAMRKAAEQMRERCTVVAETAAHRLGGHQFAADAIRALEIESIILNTKSL